MLWLVHEWKANVRVNVVAHDGGVRWTPVAGAQVATGECSAEEAGVAMATASDALRQRSPHVSLSARARCAIKSN